jgi:hypothetical protein
MGINRFYKIIIIILYFFVPYCSCTSDILINSSDYQYYKTAIDFIKNDTSVVKFVAAQVQDNKINTPLSITVSPKIVPVDLTSFESFAIKNKMDFTLDNKFISSKNSERSLTDSLLNIEESLNYSPYTDKNLESFSTSANGNLLLFFSRHYNNFLSAKVFINEKNSSINDMPSFGAALSYLFIFNDGKIEKVMAQIVSFN